MFVVQMTIEDLRGLIAAAVADAMPKTIQAAPVAEIIDRNELLKRLSISEPTIIRWEKKGKIPVLHIGTVVRYDYQAVLKALEIKS